VLAISGYGTDTLEHAKGQPSMAHLLPANFSRLDSQHHFAGSFIL
jgi:hypothetical protein